MKLRIQGRNGTFLSFALGLTLVTCFGGLEQSAHAFGKSKPAVEEDSTLAPGEPSYCLYQNLKAKEISTSGLDRVHAFVLGQVRLTGVAVGDSNNNNLKSYAQSKDSILSESQGYCTFYFNDGDDEARKIFNWTMLPKPTGSNYSEMTTEYDQLLHGIFDRDRVSFLSCARDHGTISLGCDGMRHRGPTVFAMLLAYSGCTPKHATEIVNKLWGENGISASMREAISQRAYEIGQQNSQQSAELRALLGEL